MARLAGMVQGVVVQIRIETGRPAYSLRDGGSSRSGNFTVMDGDVWSWYSTSASARAVRQEMHQ